MPIFEYRCLECGQRFEELVRSGNANVQCPQCAARRVERLLSVFAAHGSQAGAAGFEPGAACGRCGDPNGPCAM